MLQITDGRTCVEYQTTDKVPNQPPIVYGWRIHWPQMARFLDLTEETIICHVKDSDLEYAKTYSKSDLYRVAVINGYEEDRSERIMGHLCRTKTRGEPRKFVFYPGRGMSQELLEAFYPSAKWRAQSKLRAELMLISEDGVQPWYFIGGATRNLYAVDDKIFLLRDNGNLISSAKQDGLTVSGSSARFLSTDALGATAYASSGIEDVDSFIHAGLVGRNHDVLETMKQILTEEEFKALA